MIIAQHKAGARAARPQHVEGGRAARARKRPLLVALRFVIGLPSRALLLLICLYQRTLSPALPAIFGSACGCRFAPTCSHYATDAIRIHGAIIGIGLAAIRLVKCSPLHPGGFDPVPPRRRPSCRSIG